MVNSLEEIRARLKALDERKSGNKSSTGDNTVYPHWNIQEGETATLRFLPDADETNPFFWVERQVIRLPFPGVIGVDNSKPVTVQVPCGEMYGDNCPVLTAVRPFFKDPQLEDMGRKYWKKRSYIFQGFVIEDPLNEDADSVPENPIRRFMISPQIYNIIKEALMDPDMENVPTDYDAGTNFRVSKTNNGQHAQYTTSSWSRKDSALTTSQRDAVDQFGLFDLKTFLPQRPTTEQYDVIFNMFEASIEGEMYDPEKWAAHYKPYGVEIPESVSQLQKASESAQEKSPEPAPAESASSAEEAAEPEVANSGSEEKPSADDILSMIRSRK